MPVSIKKKAAEGCISANSVQNKSPPKGSEEEMEGARISPSSIFPLLKAKSAIKRGRSARRSEIMMYSPFKASLMSSITNRKKVKETLHWAYCSRAIVFRKEEDVQGENILPRVC